MEREFYCDICSSIMSLKENVKTRKKYQIRRFQCPVCDYQTTIFADGVKDTITEPFVVKELVDEQYKQEEENRS